MSSQPARHEIRIDRLTDFHLPLRVEVRARVVELSGRLDDQQIGRRERRHESTRARGISSHRLREHEEPVEVDALRRSRRVRPRNRDRRARRVVVRIRKRDRDAQTVRATPHEDRDDDVAVRRVVVGHDDLRQPGGEERRRRDSRRGRDELSTRELVVLLATAVDAVLVVHRGASGQYHWNAFALIAKAIVSRTRVSLNVPALRYDRRPLRVTSGISPPKKFWSIRSTAASGEPARYAVVSTSTVVAELKFDIVVANDQRGRMLPAQYSILSG